MMGCRQNCFEIEIKIEIPPNEVERASKTALKAGVNQIPVEEKKVFKTGKVKITGGQRCSLIRVMLRYKISFKQEH